MVSRVLSDKGRFSTPAKLSWVDDVAEHTCLAFRMRAYALAKQNVLVFLPLLVMFFPSPRGLVRGQDIVLAGAQGAATYFKCTSVWECMASPHTRPVSSTTAAAVSSQLVSIPRTSLGGESTPGQTLRLLKNP